MTHNSNDVIAPTVAYTGCYFSLSFSHHKVALPSSSPFLVVGVLVVVGVVVLMFKLLYSYLAKICTLTAHSSC